MPKTEHWTLRRSREYRENAERWSYAWTHYLADMKTLRDFPGGTQAITDGKGIRDRLAQMARNSRDQTGAYPGLYQRAQGEPDQAFLERLKTSDYLPLFGTLVDSTVGRIMAAEPISGRVWQQEGERVGLGDPEDRTTTAGHLWRDADGRGTNWLTLMEDAGVMMMTLGEVWGYVRGPTTAWGSTRLTLVEPSHVVQRFTDSGGNVVEALLEGERDLRTSLREPPDVRTVYTYFVPEGTYEYVTAQGKDDEIENENPDLVPYNPANPAFRYYKTSSRRKGDEIIPLYRTCLPLRRKVGYNLAVKNNVLFNQESERDFLLRIACTPKGVLVGTAEQIDEMLQYAQKGDNVLILDPEAQNKHYYMSPDIQAATVRGQVIREKIADFFTAGFRSYEDSVRGRQKTATEIEQDQASGEASFLATLATGLDEFESQAGWLIEQVEFPDQPQAWDQFEVQRPRKYRPFDEREEAERLARIFFPASAPPVGATARKAIAENIARSLGAEPVEEEVGGEVAAVEEAEGQLDSLLGELGLNGTNGLEG